MRTESGLPRIDAPPQPATDLIGRTTTHVRQFICGLHGHDALLHFEQGRMSLQCSSCGYETPGWELKREPAHANAPKAPGHVIHLPLVGERRVA